MRPADRMFETPDLKCSFYLADEDALKEIAQTNSLTSSARNDFYSSWKEDFYEVGRHLLASLVGEPSNLIPLDDEEADNSDESTRGKK